MHAFGVYYKVQSLFSVCVHIIIRNIEWIHHHHKRLSTCAWWSIVMVRDCTRMIPHYTNVNSLSLGILHKLEGRKQRRGDIWKCKVTNLEQLFPQGWYHTTVQGGLFKHSMLLCESTMQFLFLFLSLYSFLSFLLHGFQLFKCHRLHGHYFGLAKNRHRSLLSEKESLFRKNFLEYNLLSGHLCLLLR